MGITFSFELREKDIIKGSFFLFYTMNKQFKKINILLLVIGLMFILIGILMGNNLFLFLFGFAIFLVPLFLYFVIKHSAKKTYISCEQLHFVQTFKFDEEIFTVETKTGDKFLKWGDIVHIYFLENYLFIEILKMQISIIPLDLVEESNRDHITNILKDKIIQSKQTRIKK